MEDPAEKVGRKEFSESEGSKDLREEITEDQVKKP